MNAGDRSLPASPSAGRRGKSSTPGTIALSTLLKRIALVGLAVILIWWIFLWKRCILYPQLDLGPLLTVVMLGQRSNRGLIRP